MTLCLLVLVLTGDAWSAESGPLGEWPRFEPIGYITAPDPRNSARHTQLYGDWGAIVGEEFLFLQGSKVKLLYHSWHETYLTERAHGKDPLQGWALGYDPSTKERLTPLVEPGGPKPGPAWGHTDTPAYLHHPVTREHLLYNTVRPGTKGRLDAWKALPGQESSIQVAVSRNAPAMGVPFRQSYENALVAELPWERGWAHEGFVRGGLSEPSAVWIPHLGEKGRVRLFYRGLNAEPGSWWTWRISYADSDDGKTGWVKKGKPVFDPADPENPAHRWTRTPPDGFRFRGAWQAHCTGDEWQRQEQKGPPRHAEKGPPVRRLLGVFRGGAAPFDAFARRAVGPRTPPRGGASRRAICRA